jgi:hypothetical protein
MEFDIDTYVCHLYGLSTDKFKYIYIIFDH